MHGTVRQSHATRTDGTVPCIYAYGTVPHVPYAYGTVPYVLYAYGTCSQSRTRMGQSHTRIYIAIIIDHPIPSNSTSILWHWIIYFTSNNIQTPMNMYLTVKRPNKHATKATTAISGGFGGMLIGNVLSYKLVLSYKFVEYFIIYNNNLPR